MGYCSTGISDADKQARKKAENKKGYHIRKVKEEKVMSLVWEATYCQNVVKYGNLKVVNGTTRIGGSYQAVYFFDKLVYQMSNYIITRADYCETWVNELKKLVRIQKSQRWDQARKVANYRAKTKQIDAAFG